MPTSKRNPPVKGGYYAKNLAWLSNVTVSDYSPRDVGEREANSEWKEIHELEYEDGRIVSWGNLSRAQRVEIIAVIASMVLSMYVRPATRGGGFRVWVKEKPTGD
jgi:hypothetical protein